MSYKAARGAFLFKNLLNYQSKITCFSKSNDKIFLTIFS
nr:MAG TPA: hypothetical protein [Inoviridae sp.]